MSSTGVMPPLIFGRKAYPKGSAKSSLQNEDHGPARALPRFAAPTVRAGTPGEAPLPAPRFFPTLRGHVAIHSRPIRRLTEAADGEGACGLPLPSREGKLPLCCRIVLKNTLTAGGASVASLERRVPAAWSCGMEGDEERK